MYKEIQLNSSLNIDIVNLSITHYFWLESAFLNTRNGINRPTKMPIIADF